MYSYSKGMMDGWHGDEPEIEAMNVKEEVEYDDDNLFSTPSLINSDGKLKSEAEVTRDYQHQMSAILKDLESRHRIQHGSNHRGHHDK